MPGKNLEHLSRKNLKKCFANNAYIRAKSQNSPTLKLPYSAGNFSFLAPGSLLRLNYTFSDPNNSSNLFTFLQINTSAGSSPSFTCLHHLPLAGYTYK